ncbi:MAG TPA: hypothetical protein VNT79_04570 [Phycisphaerae bacterium]|nr:hypothetical protein [Phycisphaerae bacterium]
MLPEADAFTRSIQEQIRVNQARTPTERFLALCDLLDAARAMAPRGPEARERRRRALLARQQDRENLREFCRRLVAAGATNAGAGV